MNKINGLLSLVLVFCCFRLVNAQVRIYPEGQKVIAPPGETVKGNIWVIGPDDKKLEVEIQPEDWSAGMNRKSGVDWLKIKPMRFTIQPKEMKEIKWIAKVPKDAKGDLVAQIFFASITSEIGAIKIGTRIAYGLYITVKGTEKVSAEISGIDIKQKNRNTGFAVIFKNTGNVHLRTKGEIILEHLDSGTTRQLELHPWFYRSGESFPLWYWLTELLNEGKYSAVATVFYTDPTGKEQRVSSKINFSINAKGEISVQK